MVLRRPALSLCALLVAGLPLHAEERPKQRYSIEQFMATTAFQGASFSADESRILFSSNASGVPNVWQVPTAGGAPTAITTSPDSTYAVSFFPPAGGAGGERFLFTRDKGGDELNHLYVREQDGSEKDLTPGEKLKAQFSGWSHAGDAFFVATNERDPRYFDLYRYDATTYARTLLYKNEAGDQPGAISGDGRYVATEKPGMTAESDLYLVDTKTGERKHLSPHQGQVEYEPEEFDPLGEWLYYRTNDGGEFKRLRRYHLRSGKHEDVESPAWDVMGAAISHGGTYRATWINADGRTRIKLYDHKTGREMPLPKLPGGDVTALFFSRSEKKLAFYLNGDRSPSDLYVLDLPAGEPRRLTNAMNPQIDPTDLVDTSVVRFTARDGVEIPSIFYKPLDASATKKAPAIVWVHGGPGGQTRAGYSAILQFLANHGYVILGINNRGSSGYGRTFFTADDGKHGREPLWDCIDGKKFLQSLPYVDKDRIAIAGGSYGGYMVLAALAFAPEEFQAGVDIFGVSNWVRTLSSIPAWWEAARKSLYQELGDPAKDAENLRAISPVFHADKITKPLIVLQGANDPRVLQVESDEIVAALKQKGVPVEYVVFPDEGHGFSKKKNQIDGYGKMLEFLDKHLKTSAPPPVPKQG
ncbi:MAG: S9 family peptidase [Vicinamibacteria bacterium]|nr:S9 family peptidase [Vicinamibacteria bacterium]